MKHEKSQWVFWLRISKRKQWFSYWWKTRGANFIEFQVWIFRISIGMPWKSGYVRQMGIDYINHANSENLKQPYSVLV